MALKLDNNLLEELGLGALPEHEKQLLLRQIYEKLEMNVGVRLADQMSNEQLDEFEKFVDSNDDKGAFQWLESNFPNYKDVVNQEFEKLKAEIRQFAPQMLAVAAQNAAQPQAVPGQQPMGQPMPGQQFAGAPQGMPQAAPMGAPQPGPAVFPQGQPMQQPQYGGPQPAQTYPGYPQPSPGMPQQPGAPGQYMQPGQPQQPYPGQAPGAQPYQPGFPGQQPPAGPGQ
jgi:Protein of unknown function (DUF5663)